MRYVKLRVYRNETTQHEIDVGVWEVPLIQMLHGLDNVTEIGEVESRRPYPDAEKEYDRLERRYKMNVESGVSVVAMVYGQAPGGMEALRKAINEEASAHPHGRSATSRGRGKGRGKDDGKGDGEDGMAEVRKTMAELAARVDAAEKRAGEAEKRAGEAEKRAVTAEERTEKAEAQLLDMLTDPSNVRSIDE